MAKSKKKKITPKRKRQKTPKGAQILREQRIEAQKRENQFIEEVANMPLERFNKLNKKESMEIAQKLADIANKKLQELRKTKFGTESHAYSSFTKHRGRDATKFVITEEMDLARLKSEIKTLSQWVQNKTATAEGWGKFLNDFFERLGAKKEWREGNIDEEKYFNFFKVFNRVRDIKKELTQKMSVSDVQKLVYRAQELGGTIDEQVDRVINWLEDIEKNAKSVEDILWENEDNSFYGWGDIN